MVTTTAPGIFAPVRAELAAVESCLRQAVAGEHPVLTAATERLLNSGGKRIRPALVLLAAGIFGVDTRRAVSLAAAVEMLHTATLVHDDLIDGAVLRRGVATLNAGWSAHAVVLAGDYLFARAAVLAAQTDHPPVIDRFARTLMVIVNGEMAQHFGGEGAGRREYFERIYAKTAALFALSTEAAALLGGADEAQVSALAAFGRDLGIAYQIVDDVLDLVGDPAQMGKPAGSDLRQGLFTLPVICFFETHPDDRDLRALLGTDRADPSAVERVVASLVESGAIEEALQQARGLAERARGALSCFPPSVYTEALSAVSHMVVERCS